MAPNPKLFQTYNECEYCKRPLPLSYPEKLCPNCKEAMLFHDVKDYIRENNVNEFEVAAHFQIPLKQVKAWIREGRIEYRTDNPSGTISRVFCQHCGAPISFGTLCPKCLKLMNQNKGFGVQSPDSDHTKMHYLDSDHTTN